MRSCSVSHFGLYPLAESYVVTHAARAYVPTPQLGAEFEEVSFTSSDGLRLQGWFVPSKNGATVIAFPGRRGPQKPARLLVRHGYGVLLFDRRGEGESEGDPNTFGWRGTRDLEGAIAYLESRPDVDPNRIGGVGLSVGGEVMLQAAAETDDFKAIVSEGAGVRSVREAVHVPGAGKVIFTRHSTVATLGTMVLTTTFRLPVSRTSAPRSPTALRHLRRPGTGRRDAQQPVLRRGEGAEGGLVGSGGHTGAIDAAPEEYERRVVGFFDRTIGAGR